MNFAVFELAPCFLRAELTKKDKGTERDKLVIKMQTRTKLYEQWICNRMDATGRPRRASIFSIKLIVYSFRETLSDRPTTNLFWGNVSRSNIFTLNNFGC